MFCIKIKEHLTSLLKLPSPQFHISWRMVEKVGLRECLFDVCVSGLSTMFLAAYNLRFLNAIQYNTLKGELHP